MTFKFCILFLNSAIVIDIFLRVCKIKTGAMRVSLFRISMLEIAQVKIFVKDFRRNGG